MMINVDEFLKTYPMIHRQTIGKKMIEAYEWALGRELECGDKKRFAISEAHDYDNKMRLYVDGTNIGLIEFFVGKDGDIVHRFEKNENYTPPEPSPDPDYDSQVDTLLHIKRVNQLLGEFAQELIRRGMVHDDSKLEAPEKDLFDQYTPKLKGVTYGSDEYKQFLEELKPALDWHYQKNSHHPEHYENGINGMDLADLVEMFFDWKAASERHDDGDIFRSIDQNKDRFDMSDQLCDIFRNTAKTLGYDKQPNG